MIHNGSEFTVFPFILKSHNNTDTTHQNAYLNQVQVNLIYNTNRISTADLYNPTADRWSCHLPNRNKQRTCIQCGSLPLLSDIKGTEIPPANISIQLERQLTALQLVPGDYILLSRKLYTFCYMTVQTAPCYVQSF